jgi:hypothetical protein
MVGKISPNNVFQEGTPILDQTSMLIYAYIDSHKCSRGDIL